MTYEIGAHKRGFTLIELLVVIAIIGLLASIVLAAVNPARKKSRDARRVTDLRQARIALELYYNAVDPTSYPPVAAWADLTAALAPTYIDSLPVDPINDSTYYYQFQATNGAASPLPCNVSPCPSYVMEANTETNSISSGITGLKAGIQCSSGSSAPFHYCIIP